MGNSGSIQNNEPTLTDLRQPPDIEDRETMDKAESFPCLNLSESGQNESRDKNDTNLKQLDPKPNIPPRLEPEDNSKPLSNNLPQEPESKTVPNHDFPHMESVSLSDGEESKDDPDDKTKVVVNDVITNDVVANDVSVNSEKYSSAFLLERIRELKEERDQVRIPSSLCIVFFILDYFSLQVFLTVNLQCTYYD